MKEPTNKKLYIVPHIEINSLNSLLKCLYWEVRTNNWKFYANPTFLDKECTKYECTASRRSFEDILCIARTYFPDVTEKDVLSEMKALNFDFLHCPDINKIVFMHNTGNSLITENQLNKYPNKYYKYCDDSTYTAEDLLEIYHQLT